MGFDKSTLNNVQYNAVTSTSKRLLLLSGAGSGKTHTIISRIIYLLDNQNVNPNNILALTFSNKAAEEVKERVEKSVSSLSSDRITVKTFHKLGSYILRLFGDRIGLNPSGFSIYDESDSLDLLKSCYPEITKNDLKTPLKSILEAKDRGFSANNYLSWRSSKDEYQSYFEKYDNALRLIGNVDFADLINLPIALLEKNPDVCDILHQRFKYIFVDEYQDTNKTQFELLKLLVSPQTNLCVVGDDDQSIYSFRGADVDYILNFTDTFDSSEILTLDQNYRSSKRILSLANSLIKNNKSRHEKTLWTENQEGIMPTLMWFRTASDEASAVVNMIKESGNPKSTAIIYRTNAQSREFEVELNSLKIPYRILKSSSFYDKEVIKDAIAYIFFCINDYDIVSFSRIVAKPARGLGRQGLSKIEEKVIQNSIGVFQTCDSLNLSSKIKEELGKFKDCIDRANSALAANNKTLFFSSLYKDTGFIEYYKARDEKEENSNENSHINALKSFVATLSNIEGGREEILSLLENIALRTSADVEDTDGVTLATMHAVKGLEFDNVYITGMENELIPSPRNRGNTKSIEEERRLFYVAITRAKKKLYITYANHRMLNGKWSEVQPSPFLSELDEKYYVKSLEHSYNSAYFFNNIVKKQKTWRYDNAETNLIKPKGQSNRQKIDAMMVDFENYKKSILSKREQKTNANPEKQAIISKYSIGDRVHYEKLSLDGTILSLRTLGGHTIVDVELDNGQKTSLVDTSKLIVKI